MLVTAQLPADAIEQAIIDALVAHRVDREGPDFDDADPSLLGYARAVARVARTEADDSYGRGRKDGYDEGYNLGLAARSEVEKQARLVLREERRTAYDRGVAAGRADATAQLVALADRLDDDCAGHGVASAISPGLRNAADVLTGVSWLLKPAGEAK